MGKKAKAFKIRKWLVFEITNCISLYFLIVTGMIKTKINKRLVGKNNGKGSVQWYRKTHKAQ